MFSRGLKEKQSIHEEKIINSIIAIYANVNAYVKKPEFVNQITFECGAMPSQKKRNFIEKVKKNSFEESLNSYISKIVKSESLRDCVIKKIMEIYLKIENYVNTDQCKAEILSEYKDVDELKIDAISEKVKESSFKEMLAIYINNLLLKENISLCRGNSLKFKPY